MAKNPEVPGPKEDMIIKVGTTEVGHDGFVVKTETKDAGSADDIVEKSLRAHGYIHITFTGQGVTAAWSSAHPVTTLSHFLQGVRDVLTNLEQHGAESAGSSQNE